MMHSESRKKDILIKIALFVILVAICTALLYPFLMSRYVAFNIKWSLKERPEMFVIPSKREIPNSTRADFVPTEAGLISLQLPSWTTDERGIDTATILNFSIATGTTATIAIFNESGLAVYDSLVNDTERFKSENEVAEYYSGVDDLSNFGFVTHILSLTPEDIRFFSSNSQLQSDTSLLVLKSKLFAGYPETTFTNQHGVRGFIAPVENGHYILLFSEDDRPQELLITGVDEELLLQILNTVRFR